MNDVYVTRTFLPPMKDYQELLSGIWSNHQVTNQGPLLRDFEVSMKKYLGIDNFQFVSNGTIALQVGLKALGITKGEIITTPFSYVATTSSILWERCDPVYVDIDKQTLNIDPEKIESAITSKTKAILAVHVFGNPCEIEKIEAIARKFELKVIYDGAHAFGVKYKDRQLLSYGDISTCSFHATKTFHTIEGGAIISKEKNIDENIDTIKRFGHDGDNHFELGINAKATEFQAAMGLANLPYFESNLTERKELSEYYDKLLKDRFLKQRVSEHSTQNFTYYPVIFDSETVVENVVKQLTIRKIHPRRYFYPSLNTLPYLKEKFDCPVSEDIAGRILCLPLYNGLSKEIINRICEVVRESSAK